MASQKELLYILNNVLNQEPLFYRGGLQAYYYCPFCNHHKKKLNVNLSTGQWNCWVCRTKGSYIGSLLKKINAPKEYRIKAFELTKNVLRKSKYYELENNNINLSLPREFKSLYYNNKSIEYKNAIIYLKKRNVFLCDIIRYNIGYCEDGEYENHIIIPSYDLDGNLNFFIGRRYYDSIEYINYKKPKVSMNIVGFEYLINYSEPLNLCEGVFDAISIRNNAIPLFGKYISKNLQKKLIINSVKRVNLILDRDALIDSIKNCQILMKLGIPVYLVYLDGKDPSELGFYKMQMLIDNSEEFTEKDLLKYKLNI